MTAEPWLSDACSLVDAFRAGTISPTEALEGSLAAVASSKLNAVCSVDEERARRTAAAADVTLPFGGVPIGVKELDPVKEWPLTEASLVHKDRVSDYDGTMTARLRAAGAVLAGQTTASEFGGINCTYTRLHGATSNPYDLERTPGGSSGGSAAAVAGGLFPIATGGDGGGSIRIPAGFTGLFGLKATFGRIPKGPVHGGRAADGGPRLPGPLGARRGTVVRRLQRVRRVRPVLASPGSGAGRPGSTGRTSAGGGSPCAPTSGRRSWRVPCARRSRTRPAS